MKVINDLFDYDLKIIQGDNSFKFSLDSILLAEFVKLNGVNHVLDLCCGNAAVPLILSTKSSCKITGVEVQKDIYNNAIESIGLNDLSGRINIINDDVNNILDYDLDSIDAITCNPPYFKYDNSSILNEDISKSIARHEILIDLEKIICLSSKLLENKKSLYIVHRSDRLDEILFYCNKYDIRAKDICLVNTNESDNISLVLVRAVKNSNFGVKVRVINVKNLISYKNIFWK